MAVKATSLRQGLVARGVFRLAKTILETSVWSYYHWGAMLIKRPCDHNSCKLVKKHLCFEWMRLVTTFFFDDVVVILTSISFTNKCCYYRCVFSWINEGFFLFVVLIGALWNHTWRKTKNSTFSDLLHHLMKQKCWITCFVKRNNYDEE